MKKAIVEISRGFLALVALACLMGSILLGQAQDNDDRGVARISLTQGDVSVKRGDSGEWTAAAVNAPLVVGDHVFTGVSSHAEVQFDYSNMIRLASDAEIRMAELEYRRYQIQVAKGLVTFRVLRDIDADVEVATPSVGVRPVKKGVYRIFVRPDGSAEITVRSGEAEVFTPQGSERLKSGKTMLVRGSRSQPEVQVAGASSKDDWDRWNERRDDDLLRSRSYQYVSNDVYGADDLDAYGGWVNVAPYGNVWRPRVGVGWAPYRHGRWGWVDYYGWNWISYDPWGWAPYHYGRWFNNPGYGWCWWPGGIGGRQRWSPGLVAFVGWNSWSGLNIGLGAGFGFGRVGWVPLAPFETYRPWYGRGFYGGNRNRNYIDNSVNVVNNVNITNIYRNSRVNNSITTVDGDSFVRGRGGNYQAAPAAELRRANLVEGQVPMTPQRGSLRYSDGTPRTFESNPARDGFVSRRQAASVERVPFEQQQRGMEEVSRRAMAANGGGSGRGESARGEPARGDAGSPAAAGNVSRGSGAESRGGNTRVLSDGSRVTGEPAERNTRGEAGASRATEGWRRFGEPIRTEDAGATRGSPSGQEGRGSESRGSVDNQSARPATDGGWRRFGEPMRGSEGSITRGESRTDSGSRSESIGRGEADTRTGEGWRGLGSRRSATETGRENPVYIGGGDEGRSSSGRGGSINRSESRGAESNNDGWRGLGTRRNDSGGRNEGSVRGNEGRSSEGRGNKGRSAEGRGSESIRMNPGVLQERRQAPERSAPNVERGDPGSGRRGGESRGYEPRQREAPPQSQPQSRSNPGWSFPGNDGRRSGGGGGYETRGGSRGDSGPSFGGSSGGSRGGGGFGGGGRSSGGSAPSMGGGGGGGSRGSGGGSSGGGGRSSGRGR